LAFVLEGLGSSSVENGGVGVLGWRRPDRLAVGVVEDRVAGGAWEAVNARRAVDGGDAASISSAEALAKEDGVEEHRSRGVAVAGPVELHHQPS